MPQQTAIRQRLQVFEPFGKPIAHNLGEVRIDGEPGRNRKLGERIAHALQLQAAALGDLDRLIQDVRDFSKHAIHFLARLEIKLVGVELHAVGIIDGLAGLNT